MQAPEPEPEEEEEPEEPLVLAPLEPGVQRAVEELCRAIEPQSLSRAAQRPMPRGLQNTGNLCFMNSIMQVRTPAQGPEACRIPAICAS